MKVFVSVGIMLLMVAGYGGLAMAEESMCESVEKHISTARKYGGEGKARERASKILLAHRYMSRSISQPDLIRCVLKGVDDSKYIRAQALEAGIPKNTVDTVIPDPAALARAERMKRASAYKAPSGAYSPPAVTQTPVERPVERPVEMLEGVAMQAPASVQAEPVMMPAFSEESCGAISPWTWCAE